MIFSTARRIGCSIILLVTGAVAWHFRDLWLPKVLRFVERTVGW